MSRPDFDWSEDNSNIVLRAYGSIAVHENPYGAVVIRQERDAFEDDDYWVVVPVQDAEPVPQAIIDKAREIKRGDIPPAKPAPERLALPAPAPPSRTGTKRQGDLLSRNGGDQMVDARPGFEMVNRRPQARDPRQMTAAKLAEAGHRAMSPTEAIRARCLDCSGGSPQEVRLCAHVACPSWPFRIGKNPWRAPPSEAQREARRESAARMARAVRNLVALRASEATGDGGTPHGP